MAIVRIKTATGWHDLTIEPVGSIVMEGWRKVGDTGQPAFENSWAQKTPAGSAYEYVSFRKKPDGKVQIKGTITGGTLGATVFTLPTGYRPLAGERFALAGYNGSTGVTSMGYVDSTGIVQAYYGSNVEVSLDGIEFEIGQDTFPVGTPTFNDPTDTAWIDLPLTSPWVQYDTNQPYNFRAQYRRYRGLVHIRGLVKTTTPYTYSPQANLNIATMPAGFRPGAYVMGEGYQYESGTQRAILRIDLVPATGVMSIIGPNNDWAFVGGNGGNPAWLKLTFPPYIPES